MRFLFSGTAQLKIILDSSEKDHQKGNGDGSRRPEAIEILTRKDQGPVSGKKNQNAD